MASSTFQTLQKFLDKHCHNSCLHTSRQWGTHNVSMPENKTRTHTTVTFQNNSWSPKQVSGMSSEQCHTAMVSSCNMLIGLRMVQPCMFPSWIDTTHDERSVISRVRCCPHAWWGHFWETVQRSWVNSPVLWKQLILPYPTRVPSC